MIADPQSAPEVPPARSLQASPADVRTRAGDAPPSAAAACSAAVTACVHAAAHADAVVAVAGDRVEPAQFLFVFDDDVPDLAEHCDGLPAEFCRGRGGAFDGGRHFRVPDRRVAAGPRGARLPLRNAGVSAGAAQTAPVRRPATAGSARRRTCRGW